MVICLQTVNSYMEILFNSPISNIFQLYHFEIMGEFRDANNIIYLQFTDDEL